VAPVGLACSLVGQHLLAAWRSSNGGVAIKQINSNSRKLGRGAAGKL
jgi:hypothetical protein